MIESIVLMTDERTRRSFEAMSAEDAGNILKGLLRHAAGEEIDDSDWSPLALAVYPLIEGQVDRMSELREKRAAAGRASADSKAAANFNKAATNEQQTSTPIPVPVPEPIPEPIQEKEAATQPRKSEPRFVPPTLEQVQAYVTETGLSMDARRFVDYFSSNGWKVGGKAPMRDWKAAARNWAARDRKESPPKTDYKSKLMSMDYGDLLRRQT